MPFCRFPNLGILHVTRKKVVDVLTDRFIQNKAMQITMQGGDPSSQLGEGRGLEQGSVWEVSRDFVPVSCDNITIAFYLLCDLSCDYKVWDGRLSFATPSPRSHETLVSFQDCVNGNDGYARCVGETAI